MKKHTKIYMEFFGYGEQDFVPCEICGGKCVDVHHIDARGMGGSKTKDYIENLMGVCREHHNKSEIGKISKISQRTIHLDFIKSKRPDYECKQFD